MSESSLPDGISIRQVTDITLVQELRHFLLQEWPELDPLTRKGMPAPLCLSHNGRIIGGLCFTLHTGQNQSHPMLWVNAVLIEKRFRRQGLASALAGEAVSLAAAGGHPTLSALTDVPGLYPGQGWFIHEEIGDGMYVMRTLLNPESPDS